MSKEKIRIWVDADSFPVLAKEHILKTAIKNNIFVTYVANRNIPFTQDNPLFTMKICQASSGAADDYIVTNSLQNDIIVTRDILLAQRLVEKNITVINDRGTKFSKANLPYLLEQRELSMQMASLGLHTGTSWKSYNKKELEAFANCLEKVLKEKNIL